MKSRRFTKEGREWELPDAFYRVAIKLIIKDNKERLLVLKDENTNEWELPGGGLDHGEDIAQAAKREIQEELGVEITEMDETPIAIEIGLHLDNYMTVKLYYFAKLSNFAFTHEDKFTSKFVSKEEFTKLGMPPDESPIQKRLDEIWPSG